MFFPSGNGSYMSALFLLGLLGSYVCGHGCHGRMVHCPFSASPDDGFIELQLFLRRNILKICMLAGLFCTCLVGLSFTTVFMKKPINYWYVSNEIVETWYVINNDMTYRSDI